MDRPQIVLPECETLFIARGIRSLPLLILPPSERPNSFNVTKQTADGLTSIHRSGEGY